MGLWRDLHVRCWLVLACVTAPGVWAYIDKPRVPPALCPANSKNCEQIGNQTFLIAGKPHWMTIKGTSFTTSCSAIPLGHSSWPIYPETMGGDNIITGCAPLANGSYLEALKKSSKVMFIVSLSLLDLPTESNFSAGFRQFIPTTLQMQSVGKVIVLPAEALRSQIHIKVLKARRVRVSEIPAKVNDIELIETGLKELKPGFLKQFTNIKLEERDIQSIVNQSSPQLVMMKLTTPSLKTLVLYDTHLRGMPGGFLAGCGQLKTIELLRPGGYQVADGFLFGAPFLESFKMVGSKVSFLPEYFFSYTPRLTSIDLSDNQLKNLHENLFARLPLVKELKLQNNRLYLHDVIVVAKVTTLERLAIGGNDLRDFCPHVGESILANLHLTYLNMSNASLSRICPDWIEVMTSLETLDLSNNKIKTLSCKSLKVDRNPDINAVIKLDGNPIELYDCTDIDSQRAALSPQPKQNVVLSIPPVECECGPYWLMLTAPRMGVTVDDHNAQGVNDMPHCAEPWVRCLL